MGFFLFMARPAFMFLPNNLIFSTYFFLLWILQYIIFFSFLQIIVINNLINCSGLPHDHSMTIAAWAG